MKKKIISATLAVFIMISLCSCVVVEREDKKKDTSMFAVVETAALWKVVYHRETKVMYAVSYGSYNDGTFTLLVNPDGTPMLWGG